MTAENIRSFQDFSRIFYSMSNRDEKNALAESMTKEQVCFFEDGRSAAHELVMASVLPQRFLADPDIAGITDSDGMTVQDMAAVSGNLAPEKFLPEIALRSDRKGRTVAREFIEYLVFYMQRIIVPGFFFPDGQTPESAVTRYIRRIPRQTAQILKLCLIGGEHAQNRLSPHLLGVIQNILETELKERDISEEGAIFEDKQDDLHGEDIPETLYGADRA